MLREQHDPALHVFAVGLTVLSAGLIGVGGRVTSHEAGLAVPDWPSTFGHNMFLFPVSRWVGGIYFEHTHRLLASGVGFLTVVLAVWLWRRETRLWLVRLGWFSLLLVVMQGVIGGLRVIALQDWLGVVHAGLAQLFLAVIMSIALFTSRWWRHLSVPNFTRAPLVHARRRAAAIGILILVQLLLGAAMRHQHAGLAVRTFPRAYDETWWPRLDAASVSRYNQDRQSTAQPPVTAIQIAVHLIHRYLAAVILLSTLWNAAVNASLFAGLRWLVGLSLGLFLLAVLQFELGAWVVWSDKAPGLATWHLMVGTVILSAQILLYLQLCRCLQVTSPEKAQPH
jgi:heme a synthase